MYKYDIHVHTKETSPCGKVEAVDVVKLYKSSGYTGIVITDHYYKDFFDKSPCIGWNGKIDDYLKGYKKALREGTIIGLHVLLGMEIKFNDNPNDYLVYGIDEDFLKNNPELYNLDLKEFKDVLSGTNTLIYQAHPFRKGQYVKEPELLDGIEVYNGNPRHDSHNEQAYNYAIKKHLKYISGSDFHQVCDIAKGGIIVNDYITTINELIMVLNKNNTIDLIKNDNS